MKKKIIIVVGIIGVLLIATGIGFKVFGTKPEKDTTDTEVKEYDGTGEKQSDGLPDESNYKVNDDGSFTNTVSEIAKKHTSGDISIENMSINLKEKESLANYSYTIKNIGNNTIENLNVTIAFIFSDKTEMLSSPYTIEKLAPGESVKVERNGFMSIVGAVDYRVEVNFQTN